VHPNNFDDVKNHLRLYTERFTMLNRNSFVFTILLGGLVAIPPLSTDIGLPAYSATAAALRTTEPTVALTLSFFMLGFAVGPLFYGPISERFGRRPVLLAGLGLYLVTSVLCTVTPSIGLLLGSRLFQGFAAASGTVLVVACIRDLFDGATGRKRMSYVLMINGVMPLIAPSIGVFILAAGGWRSIYAFMTAGGVLLMLGVLFGFAESIPKKSPHALEIWHLLRGYKEVLMHPVSAKAALLNAFGFGVMFTYISCSPLLFISNMHVSQHVYGLIFSVTVIGTICGTLFGVFLNGRPAQPTLVIRLGLSLTALATFVLLVVSVGDFYRLPVIVALLFASNFGFGLSGPTVSYAAVQYLPHLAGVASAVLASSQMIVASIAATLVASLFGVMGPSTMGVVMFGFALLACGLYAVTPFNAPLEPTSRRGESFRAQTATAGSSVAPPNGPDENIGQSIDRATR
jgi:DHA1 family bicyclomycin/chloramphenicol resistance-like MFS transporter